MRGADPEAAPPWDAVVLLQMGGPATLDEVEPFLAALFRDADIIRLPRWMRPFQPTLARFVARRRAPLVRPRYEAMGGGSPLGEITREQAGALEKVLGVPVHVCMRYTAPWADDVVTALRQAGARRVLLLPLYPHHSVSTTGSSLRDFARAARESGLDADLWHVRAWGDDARYVELVARTCEEALDEVRAQTDAPVHLLFSAHSVPEAYVREGDTYPREVEASMALLRPRLEKQAASVSLGYQSAVGPVTWIGPQTQEQIERLAAEGAQALVVAPLGFVSDHIETKYDMDTLYRGEAARLGIATYARAPSFNGRMDFADVLAGLARGSRPVPFEVGAWTA